MRGMDLKIPISLIYLALPMSVDIETSFMFSLTLKFDKVITISSFSSVYVRKIDYVYSSLILR